jgi:hypothetical protein
MIDTFCSNKNSDSKIEGVRSRRFWAVSGSHRNTIWIIQIYFSPQWFSLRSMHGIIAIIVIDNPDPIILKLTIGSQFKLFTKNNLFNRGCRLQLYIVSCDWNLAFSCNRFHKAVIVKLNYSATLRNALGTVFVWRRMRPATSLVGGTELHHQSDRVSDYTGYYILREGPCSQGLQFRSTAIRFFKFVWCFQHEDFHQFFLRNCSN